MTFSTAIGANAKATLTKIATITSVTSPGNPGGSYLDVISATIPNMDSAKTYHVFGAFSSDIFTGTAEDKKIRLLVNGTDAGTKTLNILAGETSQERGFSHTGALEVTGISSCVVKIQYSANSSDNFNNNSLKQTLFTEAVEQ